jgi:hypothetical protein
LNAKSTSKFAYGLFSPGFTKQSINGLRLVILPPFAYMHKKAKILKTARLNTKKYKSLKGECQEALNFFCRGKNQLLNGYW